MKQPFFSIVIPTKNRPELLRDAILSVLWQDFKDYELIVSDNFNDERTKKVVDEFVSDPRLRYFRTEKELNMPDHWEFASGKANGTYIFMLTDRSLFRKGALKRISDIIRTYVPKGVQAYGWQHAIFDIKGKFLRPVANPSRSVVVSFSRDLIREYARQEKVDWRFPLLPNACYHRDVATLIRNKHGRMFFPIAPDITSEFLILSYTDKIAGIGEPLLLAQTAENSNGAVCLAVGPEPYLNTLNLSNWYRYVPIKAPFISNLNFDVFLMVQAMVHKEPLFADVDWTTYFLKCYEEFVYFGINGFIKNRKPEFFGAWKKALSSFDKKVQSRVKKEMFRTKLIFSAKAILANSPLLLSRFLRHLQGRLVYRSPVKYYSNALEAAGFDNNVVASKMKNK